MKNDQLLVKTTEEEINYRFFSLRQAEFGRCVWVQVYDKKNNMKYMMVKGAPFYQKTIT